MTICFCRRQHCFCFALFAKRNMSDLTLKVEKTKEINLKIIWQIVCQLVERFSGNRFWSETKTCCNIEFELKTKH